MPANYENRPKKRLALREILRNAQGYIQSEFVYITLSSTEILDVNFLLEVVNKDQITKIIAYEKNEERAIQASNSEVAKRFEGKIKIINSEFPESLEDELESFSDIQKIVFFDGEEWFCNKKSSKTRTEFEDLLEKRVLGHNDIYLITSCMAQRSWHTIENQLLEYYNYYYAKTASTHQTQEELKKMLMDNVVDLNVEVAIRNCNSVNGKIGSKERIFAERLGKIKYNDTGHTDMVLLCFRFVNSTSTPKALDIPFDYEKEYVSSRVFENIWEKVLR